MTHPIIFPMRRRGITGPSGAAGSSASYCRSLVSNLGRLAGNGSPVAGAWESFGAALTINPAAPIAMLSVDGVLNVEALPVSTGALVQVRMLINGSLESSASYSSFRRSAAGVSSTNPTAHIPFASIYNATLPAGSHSIQMQVRHGVATPFNYNVSGLGHGLGNVRLLGFAGSM